MALIKRWSDESTGLVCDSAYHKVNGVLFDYVGRQTHFNVLVYRDSTARLAGKEPFTSRNFAIRNISSAESVDGEAHNEFDTYFDLKVLEADGVNPVAQVYAWLKGHPLYSGAADA